MNQPQVVSDDNPLLDTKEAAKLLNVSPGTLEVWRSTKRYALPYSKIGGAVRYRRSAVQEFIAARTVAA